MISTDIPRQQRLTNYILNEVGRMPAVGLYHGQMGAVLALSLYARQQKDDLLENLLQNLLNAIYEKISVNMPLGMEDGLVGIGYGLTLMAEFTRENADLDDALHEVDQCVMYVDPTRYPDLSFRTGLAGVWAYIRERRKIGSSLASFDERYMNLLTKVIIDNGLMDHQWSLLEQIDTPSFEADEYVGKILDLSGGCSFYLFQEYHDQIFHH